MLLYFDEVGNRLYMYYYDESMDLMLWNSLINQTYKSFSPSLASVKNSLAHSNIYTLIYSDKDEEGNWISEVELLTLSGKFSEPFRTAFVKDRETIYKLFGSQIIHDDYED